MPFTNSNLRALQVQSKKYTVSVGEPLFAEAYPKSGGYFVWRHQFPPGKEGKLRDYQISPYGKGPGQWSLKASEDLSWAFMRNPHQISLGPNHPHLTLCWYLLLRVMRRRCPPEARVRKQPQQQVPWTPTPTVLKRLLNNAKCLHHQQGWTDSFIQTLYHFC